MSDDLMSGLAQPVDTPPWLYRFEDERVKMVLLQFKLLRHLRPLLDESDRLNSFRALTFECFLRFFRTFPVLLAVRGRSRVAELCSPAKLFRRFDSVFLVPLYLEVYNRCEEEAEGRPIGMVIPFDGYRGGMIVHNGVSKTRSTKLTHSIPADVRPYQITVEPFVGFLHYIARSGWTPDTPLKAIPTQQRQESRLIPFSPEMVRLLGTGPALVVMAWVMKLLNSEGGSNSPFIMRFSEQERCVVATHTEIAAATGLSERQVKRALESLRKKGFILRERKDGKTCIRVRE